MKHALWLRADDDSLDAASLVDLGAEAAANGWDGVFVSDSLRHAQYPDPWVVLAGIAARTDDVTLGTWVVPLPRRQPWQVAQEVATLDVLSGGRVLLGAGLGNAGDYEAYGREYEPRRLATRLEETLDVVVGLWGDEPFSYDGECFTLDEATVRPRPVQRPRVPIVFGG
ncbi:MAG: LLM class flavin-dependent oxidoreductase [Halobacteriaceae archaeon]